MLKTKKIYYCYFMLLIILSYFWCYCSGAPQYSSSKASHNNDKVHFNTQFFDMTPFLDDEALNTYSSFVPMSNRILEMLRDRNAALNKEENPPPPQKPITLQKASSSPYFDFMKSFANRQGIPYNIQPKPIENPQLPYIQYTSVIPHEQINGSQMLCRRLHMC